MQEEVKAIEELNEAEIDQVSGGGEVLDTIVGGLRTVSNWFGGSTKAATGVCCGLLG